MDKKYLWIYWEEIPFYAANCLSRLREEICFEIKIFGSNPKVPFTDIDTLIAFDREPKILSILFSEHRLPDVVFINGWGNKRKIFLACLYRLLGIKVNVMFDNIMPTSRIKYFYYRAIGLFLRYIYSGCFVPGENSKSLARTMFGVRLKCETGLYCADEVLFSSRTDYEDRCKRVVSIGQFIGRKNHQFTIDAFTESKLNQEGWELCIIGSGVLKNSYRTHRNVKIIDFLQPRELSTFLSKSRVFVLSSVEENWGVVVHEAALSGCLLVLSSCIGSSVDFEVNPSSNMFDPHSLKSLTDCFNKIGEIDSIEADSHRSMLRVKAEKFTPGYFISSVKMLSQNEK